MLSKIQQGYVEKCNVDTAKRDMLRKAQENAESKLLRIKDKLNNLAYVSWVDEIIKPLAQEINKHFPDRTHAILGPFGVCCETAIHFYKKEISEKDQFKNGGCVSVTFLPGDLDQGEIRIRDYSKNTGQFSENTIGQLNGMNHPSISIPKENSIQFIVDYINHEGV